MKGEKWEVPCRRIASSKSTSWASNSGPSTHVKRVRPPTVTRQAPHMPVPSTISALSDTVVFSAYFFVVRATNFIIIIGPMATHSS